jgi:hypothetical protein
MHVPCERKVKGGALAEAQRTFQVPWSYLQPHFASILNELWGLSERGAVKPNHWTKPN